AWESIGGFDEELPSLEHFDFWLRLLHAGRHVALLPHALMLRVVRDDGLYRRAWERDTHVASLTRLFEKHAEMFGRDPARALYCRERLLQDLADEYRRAVSRRDENVRELERLQTRAQELRRSVPDENRHTIDFGDLRRTTPVARDWGYERGRPIDRHYIERFLEHHAADIQGVVLEVQEPDYTRRF